MRKIISNKIDATDAKAATKKATPVAAAGGGNGPSSLANSKKTVLTAELEKKLLGGDESCVGFCVGWLCAVFSAISILPWRFLVHGCFRYIISVLGTEIDSG